MNPALDNLHSYNNELGRFSFHVRQRFKSKTANPAPAILSPLNPIPQVPLKKKKNIYIYIYMELTPMMLLLIGQDKSNAPCVLIFDIANALSLLF